MRHAESTVITLQDLAAVDLPATEMEVQISLYEAKQGTSRMISIQDPALCPECVNLKWGFSRKCFHCAGHGYVQVYRQVEIELPAGVIADQEICFPQLGRYNLCAQRNGDLIIKIKIGPHPYLELTGKNISCTLVVSFLEALLGKKILVPTIGGKAMIRLQPLTISGKVYRLKGQGIAGGDQLINVEVSAWPRARKSKTDNELCISCGAHRSHPDPKYIFA